MKIKKGDKIKITVGKDKGKGGLDNQKGGGGNKRSKLFDLELFQQIPKGTKKVDK